MKIGLAQINTTIGDFSGNTAKILRLSEEARQKGCDLAIFSELAIPGYPPTDYIDREDFVKTNLEKLDQVARAAQGLAVIVGFVDLNQGSGGKPFHNTAALVAEGKILFRAHKVLLPSYDVFDETRYFQPGVGSQVCRYRGTRIGITVCEDAWNDKDLFHERLYPHDPVEVMAAQGVDLLVNISGSPFFLGKQTLRREIFSNIARKYRVPVAYCNQVGGNDSLLFDGGSMVIDAQGQLRSLARDFEEDLIAFDPADNVGELHPSLGVDEALVLKALCVGTRDYVHKCGFRRAVIGLSGGIDSSLVACVAAEALGKENVWGIAMPSPYSSPESIEDARLLAQRLDIPLHIIPISNIFQSVLEELKPLFGDRPEDITEENLQARIRGNLLMAISNKFNSLLLTTGNKSEMAVGYCTLYGDMCGALAVISDVPKTMVYRLCHYLNQQKELIPERVLTKPPSAELKPNQTDQDSLPAYDVLDDILAEYVEQNRTVHDIVHKGHDRAVVLDVIRRIHLNEYKRKQAAPGLKVTTKAFGSGRRYPIAHRINL
jgi:NAD+ synthase (glutamine-hydrolysing)